MSDGLGFNIIAGTLLDRIVGNERLGPDLPRRGRDAKREVRHASGAASGPQESPPGQDDNTPGHIDLRI